MTKLYHGRTFLNFDFSALYLKELYHQMVAMVYRPLGHTKHLFVWCLLQAFWLYSISEKIFFTRLKISTYNLQNNHQVWNIWKHTRYSRRNRLADKKNSAKEKYTQIGVLELCFGVYCGEIMLFCDYRSGKIRVTVSFRAYNARENR